MEPVLNSLDAKIQAFDIEKSKIQHTNLNTPVVEQAFFIMLLFGVLLYDDSDNSVEIIFYGAMFSPYKSNLQRQFSKEDQKYENQKKISKRLSEWKWVEVIILDDSEDDEKEDELNDTADSSTNKKNGSKKEEKLDEIYQVFLCFFSFSVVFV
ncbi:hypothetical protein Hanom_Chr14g01334411 [Helianthus anomalus]